MLLSKKIRRFFQAGAGVLVIISLTLALSGCGPCVSSSSQVAKFKKAGPVQTLIVDQSGKSRIGPYRVIPGDVLEFQLHVSLRIVSSELAEWLRPSYGIREIEPYIVRVSDSGNITLPVIGDIYVEGKTLAQIEKTVKDSYYPKYIANPPMLFCQVKEYQSEHERVFTVAGLVLKPDAYPYPPDVQYNLMEALAFAGGFDMVADPRFVKVFRQDENGQVIEATFDVKDNGLKNAYTVAVKPGDVIYVDHTLNTRINKFLADVFHITVGATSRSNLD